jgi:hypothetical protein
MAASATFALKAGVWFRRARLLIVSPDSRADLARRQAENSTYRPVQIPEASSNLCTRHRRSACMSPPEASSIAFRVSVSASPSSSASTASVVQHEALD